ncbi:C2H2 transcription factor (Egr2) [Aspergillus flavus]|nr:C2H2 transcription factor (Egr2) [Aspergillus flavus]RAQ55542.1 C2H2 transcription factor (Egr2) [Aspergillus flavus]
MASCKAGFVSILNNDDNPSFTVRSSPRLCRHHSTSSYPYPSEPRREASNSYYRYGYAHSDSFPVNRQQFDSVSEAVQPTSPGSSDCSYDYMSAGSSYYYQPNRQEPHGYQAPTTGTAMTTAEKRLSANSVSDPPSPPASISGSRDAMATKVNRKNKYPCPFAASHNCSATFTTSGHAARHGKKHTGEKSVHCPICNKAFTRKDNMKQHIRTHRTHSEDRPTGVTEKDTDASNRWRVRRDSPLYNHHRSSSQSQMDGNAYDSMRTMR